MKTLSLDLRERILDSYDRGDGTREEIAHRYQVSLGMVKKLLAQRRRTGEIGARHHRSGRKPVIVDSHRREMRTVLEQRPDMTLAELREALGLKCTLPAIHYVLEAMGLTYKKRHCGPANRIAPTLPRPVAGGDAGRAGSTRRGLSSSTSRGRRRT